MLIRKIYISGRIAGLPAEETAAKFAAAADYWAEHGCRAVNAYEGVGKEKDAKTAMRKRLNSLIDCQAIYLLHDWQICRETRLELLNAHAMGLDIILQNLKQKNSLNEFLNTYSLQGDVYRRYVSAPTTCRCISAASKFHCEFADGYDKCHINNEKETGTITDHATAQGAGIQRAVSSINIPVTKEALEQLKKSYGFSKTKSIFSDEERQKMVLKTVARVMAASVEQQPWYTTAWEKLCVGMTVLMCMPWVAWQFIKNPYDFVRLPFAEEPFGNNK